MKKTKFDGNGVIGNQKNIVNEENWCVYCGQFVDQDNKSEHETSRCEIIKGDVTPEKHTPLPYRIGKIAGTDIWTVGKHNSSTEVFHFKTAAAAVNKYAELVGDEAIIRAVNSFETLLTFAKKHHAYVCEDCEGTGKIYNNADPTSGQWIECPYAYAIAQAQKKS